MMNIIRMAYSGKLSQSVWGAIFNY